MYLCALMGLAISNEQAPNAWYLPCHMLDLCTLTYSAVISLFANMDNDRRLLSATANRARTHPIVLEESTTSQPVEDSTTSKNIEIAVE